MLLPCVGFIFQWYRSWAENCVNFIGYLKFVNICRFCGNDTFKWCCYLLKTTTYINIVLDDGSDKPSFIASYIAYITPRCSVSIGKWVGSILRNLMCINKIEMKNNDTRWTDIIYRIFLNDWCSLIFRVIKYIIMNHTALEMTNDQFKFNSVTR